MNLNKYNLDTKHKEEEESFEIDFEESILLERARKLDKINNELKQLRRDLK